MTSRKGIQFFLGSNTKRGFVPLFDQLRDPHGGHRLYILKGGPGTGKSTLMKKIANALEDQGHFVEYIHCASDPDSLDAILDHDSRIAMVDGTAPHTMDPDYPGAYDIIINLGDAWNIEMLTPNREKIMEISSRISRCHKMAGACIAAAASLLDSNKDLAKAYVNQNAVKALALQITRELKDNVSGREIQRLLSAVTVGKMLFYENTLTTLSEKLYIISDEWGAASDMLLSYIRDYAVNNSLGFITCYCSIRVPDKIDHLLFPSLKLGIATSNTFHEIRSEKAIITEGLMGTIDRYELKAMTNHRDIAKQLLEAAAGHVERAKALHDELEKYYIQAMDYDRIEQIYHRLLDDILR